MVKVCRDWKQSLLIRLDKCLKEILRYPSKSYMSSDSQFLKWLTFQHSKNSFLTNFVLLKIYSALICLLVELKWEIRLFKLIKPIWLQIVFQKRLWTWFYFKHFHLDQIPVKAAQRLWKQHFWDYKSTVPGYTNSQWVILKLCMNNIL